MRCLLNVLGAGALALATVPAAFGAELTVRTSDDGARTFVLSGPLEPWNAVEFLAEMTNAPPVLVEMEGVGGDLVAAVRIGSMIDALDIDTHATGPCTDACAFVWLAGTTLIADAHAKIEVDFTFDAAAGDQGASQDPALVGWYFGRLALSVEMMDAYLALTGGSLPGGKLDLLSFVALRDAPVEIRGGDATTVTSANVNHCDIEPRAL
jgi:hypothetical protein